MNHVSHAMSGKQWMTCALLPLLFLYANPVFSADDQKPASVCSLENGRLTYGCDEKGNRIPDFSRVGYCGGDRAIPYVKTIITLQPQAGSVDDTARIQETIDSLAAELPDKDGVRGAVMLEKGVFKVAGTIKIKSSGIVLRGTGQTAYGTCLQATGKAKRNVVEIGNVAEGVQSSRLSKATRLVNPQVEVIDDYVPVGATSFHAKDASSFKEGDRIILHYPPSEKWIHDLGMDDIGYSEAEGKNLKWTPFSLRYERRIVQVKDGMIHIDAPIVNAIDASYGGASICKYVETGARISNSGVESLLIKSDYDRGNPKDEEHAESAVVVDNAFDCWVRNISAEHMSVSCIAIGGTARNITVQDCSDVKPVSIVTGRRRNDFKINGQLCLVQRCYSSEGRHSFVTNGWVCGPNVFLDCVAERCNGDIGPHMLWATGTLYDNIEAPDGMIYVQDRGNWGLGHGWAGANEVLWNCKARFLKCEKPATAQNYCIGCIGERQNGRTGKRPFGLWESPVFPVEPRSLYIQQLLERVGGNAMLNIVEKRQLDGSISADLIKAFRPR